MIISIPSIHVVFRLPEPQRARASCLGLNTAGASNRAEPAENRRAQRKHRLGRHTRNPASKSNGRLESGVDLFGRASRGSCAEPSGKIMRNKRRKRAFIAFGIVFLIFIHAAWATTRLRRVSRDTNFSQAKNVASFHKEVDKNSKWRETMETRVFSAEKVDVESLFAPVYPSELPTNLGSRNTRLMWLATRGNSTGVEDSWLLPAPVNRHDLRSFKRRPVPYSGCMWTGDGNSCTWSEMSATVVVYENI